MTRNTTVLLMIALAGGLALGVFGLRHFGKPQALTKEARDTHRHDDHDHAERPGAAEHHDDHKRDAHEGHIDGEHGHDEHGHDEEGVIHLSEERQKELGIEVEVAGPGTLTTNLRLTGTIAVNTDRLVHIVPRIAGIVREVRKNLGDTVRAGEVMAVIDSRELAEGKAAYLAASERLALAESRFQREKDLWEKKISPADDYINAKQALAEVRIELRLTRQKLFALGLSEQALKQLSSEPDVSLTRYEVISPLAGTVIEKHLTAGELVKDDTEIFSVADLRTLWVTLNLPPPDLPLVKEGQRVTVSAGVGFPETEGSISYIAPMVREETRAVPVRVVLPNPAGRFRPGLFVTAALSAGEAAVSVRIPQSAIQTVEGKPSVFVQTPEGFQVRPVSLGRANDTHAEVTEGLTAGERYALTETFLLKADLAKGEAGHEH